ncbi:MAG: CAP domain-containing protein [Phycisphaeraceae bacterium]
MMRVGRISVWTLTLTLLAVVMVASVTAPAQAQTRHDVDVLFHIGRREAAAEKLSQDPIASAVAIGDVQSLINLFRQSTDADLRSRAAGGILQIGGSGPARLITALSTEFRPKLKKYRGLFQEEVVATIRKRRGGASNEQIATFQKQVTVLRSDPGLTKDRIVKEGDPAMEQLEKLLSIDRATVMANSQAIKAARNELMDLAQLASRAGKHLSSGDRRTAEKMPSPAELDKELTDAENLAAFLVTPMTSEWQEVMFDNVDLAKQLDPEEAAGVLMLNLIRIRAGLQPLAIDLKLVDASRDHSKDMRTLGFFDHTSPVSGKTTPWDRAKLAGTSASGENIFYGRADHSSAIMAWWYSPGHFKNMMNPGFRRIGLGKYEGHWTQMFGS